VRVRKVDLALELQILSYYEQMRSKGLRAVPDVADGQTA